MSDKHNEQTSNLAVDAPKQALQNSDEQVLVIKNSQDLPVKTAKKRTRKTTATTKKTSQTSKASTNKGTKKTAKKQVKQVQPVQRYTGALVALVIALLFCIFTKVYWFIFLFPLVGFFIYDRPLYIMAKDKLEKEHQKKQMVANQKINRGKMSSMCQDIYTVAGFALALEENLDPYIQNAEYVIKYFKASKEDRLIAIEAFNEAIEVDFDLNAYIDEYMVRIGKNRTYSGYVLTYAYSIATIDNEHINENAKNRIRQIGKLLGAPATFIERLFTVGYAEVKFAQEYDKYQKSKASATSDNNSYQQSSSGSSNSQQSKDTSSAYSSLKAEQALSILGLTSACTFEEVRKSYKRLMLKYHPDRLAARGLSEDMIAIYTEKSKAVQVAFDYLKKLYSDVA